MEGLCPSALYRRAATAPICVGFERVNCGVKSSRYITSASLNSQNMPEKRRVQDRHIWQCKNVRVLCQLPMSFIFHVVCVCVYEQDLGMESTSLDDVLYRYASFRNLVDPITHDLIISLARYVHCPRTVGHTHAPIHNPKHKFLTIHIFV